LSRIAVLAAWLVLSACGVSPTLPPVPTAAIPTAAAPSTEVLRTATPRPYDLVCGPIERSKCEDSAAEIVGDSDQKQPTNPVVSIWFTDTCGSRIVTFRDGTRTVTMADCYTGG
jgi:hypothetical protein